MGFLIGGTPLSWPETKRVSRFIRDHGIRQFIRLYRDTKDRKEDPFKFGDEVNFSFSIKRLIEIAL